MWHDAGGAAQNPDQTATAKGSPVDAATLWPFVVFALKLLGVGALAVLAAGSLWILNGALRQGAFPQTKPDGPTYSRAKNPWRFWRAVGGYIVSLAAYAVLIHAVIHVGRAPAQPAAVQEEKPHAPARANDEAYDRS